MKILTLSLLVVIISVHAFAQNVGIGTMNPLSKLHVNGTIRADSLLLTHPGFNDAVLSLTTADVNNIAENLHIDFTAPVDGIMWQSFTATSSDTLQFISFYCNGPCMSDSMKIYAGSGIGGSLLATVALPGGSGWIQSPELNLPVTNGQVYTFSMQNLHSMTYSNNTYSGGWLNFIGNDITNLSVTFAAYTVTSGSQPILVQGTSDSITSIAHPYANATLDLKGTLNVDHLRINGGAGDGNYLTGDANGLTTWSPAPWKKNNDYIYVADTTRKVGIGTNSPAAKLHIGGSQANLLIGESYSPGPYSLLTALGDGEIRFENSIGDIRFLLDNNGNVGIGGFPFYDSRLDVQGKLRTQNFQMLAGAQNGYVMTSDNLGNASWMPNTPTSYWTLSGNDIFNNQSGNVGIGTNNPQQKLEVNGSCKIGGSLFTNGYVGIGTTSPLYPLHVFNTQGSPLAHFEGQGYNISIVEIQDMQKVFSLGLNAGNGLISINDNTPFDINIGGSTRMHISSNGNIGIGNSSPSEKLHVTGKTRTDQLQVVTGAANGNLLSSDANGNASWISKDLAGYWTKNVNDVYSNLTGNVGIGATAPLAKLHILKAVTSSGANDFILLENSNAGGAGITYKNSVINTNLWQTYVENDGKFKIGRAFLADYLTILDDGKTGINTSTPTATLEVNGSIKTKYSGTIVPAPFSSTGLQTVSITIPALPAGFDLGNTMVIVSNSDGTAVFTIHQAKLTSLTNINVKCTVISTGDVRLNWVVFKL